jgi:hypothetical protein
MVCMVLPELVSIPQSSSVAKGAVSRTKVHKVARGWMNEISASTSRGPGRRLQWRSQRAWGCSGQRGTSQEHMR